jgi:hypothetical protein
VIRLPKAPTGLLELFGLKGGVGPSEFGESIVPGIDALPFYAVDRLFSANTVNAAAAFPLNGTVNVSFPRLYFAFSAQVTLGAAAGTRLAIRIGIRAPTNASALAIVADARYAAPHLVAGGFYEAIWLAPFPLVFPPGAQFNCAATSDAAGADHVLTMKALSLDLSSQNT